MGILGRIMGRRKLSVPYEMGTMSGATADDKYSLIIQDVNGEPCLCLHKCELSNGLHYTSGDSTSFVTAIPYCHLAFAARWIGTVLEGRKRHGRK